MYSLDESAEEACNGVPKGSRALPLGYDGIFGYFILQDTSACDHNQSYNSQPSYPFLLGLILGLEVLDLVGTSVRVLDVMVGDLQVATGALQDKVDYVGDCLGLVLLEGLEPLSSNIV